MKFRNFVLLAALAALLLVMHAFSQPFMRVDTLSRTVVPPQIISVTTNAQYVFTNNPVYLDKGRVISRVMQNTGTNPVLYAIGSVSSVTNYHGVLAGGSANRDGLGSVVDLSRYPGQVSVVTESGSSTVVLVELQQ